MDLKKEIDTNGWVLIKKVFTPDEIQALRQDALESEDKKGDILSNNKINRILLDERILNIFREATGSEKLVYFGDSTVSIDSTTNGFHKDSKDRNIENSQEWSSGYSLLRMGVYLQDHSAHSKGLCLRHKSHLTQSVKKGKIINVKSEVGDVILWKLTTTHSANADVLSILPNIAFHPGIARRFPEFILQKTIKPRIALFATFGVDDEFTRDYIKYLRSRPYAIERMKETAYESRQLKELQEKNVEVKIPSD